MPLCHPSTAHRPSRRSFGAKLAAAVLLPLALTTVDLKAQPAEDLVSAAQEEASLTLYSNVDPAILEKLADAFTEQYDITVDIQRQASSALAQRFSTEASSGINLADVYLSSDRAFHEARTADGLFGSLDNVPGIAEWPQEARWEGIAAVGYNPYSLVWNAQIVTEGLDSWEDLLDPKWAGKVLLTDPRAGATSNQFYYMLRDRYGEDFLRQLGKVATFSQSAVPGIQQVAAGAQAIYAPGIHQVVVGLIGQGAPLGESFPNPTISSDNLVSIASKAPHPKAAALFVSFLMTKDGQQILNPDGFSPIAGVPNTREMPEVVTIDPKVAQEATNEFATIMGLQ